MQCKPHAAWRRRPQKLSLLILSFSAVLWYNPTLSSLDTNLWQAIKHVVRLSLLLAQAIARKMHPTNATGRSRARSDPGVFRREDLEIHPLDARTGCSRPISINKSPGSDQVEIQTGPSTEMLATHALLDPRSNAEKTVPQQGEILVDPTVETPETDAQLEQVTQTRIEEIFTAQQDDPPTAAALGSDLAGPSDQSGVRFSASSQGDSAGLAREAPSIRYPAEPSIPSSSEGIASPGQYHSTWAV